jgi:hypothetical protein
VKDSRLDASFESIMRRNIGLRMSIGSGAVLALVAALAGCSAGPLIDRVPTELGGLPADTPQRPAAPPPYPAVHDIPQSRPTPALTDADQLKLEKELAAARKEQGTLQDPTVKARGETANAAATSAGEKAKAAAKKKPSAPNDQ